MTPLRGVSPMKRSIALFVLVCLFADSTAMAVDSKGALYFGGTAAVFKEGNKPVEGRLDTKNDESLIFIADDKPFIGSTLAIPYSQIVDLEYGQKAGRRVGAAVATTVLLG